MQRNLGELADLEILPHEMRIEILSHMDPASVLAMSQVSETIRKSVDQLSDKYWEEKLIQHFPHVIQAAQASREALKARFNLTEEDLVANEIVTTAKERFIKMYEREYHDFSPILRKIFSLAKENDIDQLKVVLESPGSINGLIYNVDSDENSYSFRFLYDESFGMRDTAGRNIIDVLREKCGLNAVKLLLENASITESVQYFILNEAVKSGLVDVVKYLVEEKKLSINGDGEHASPLYVALNHSITRSEVAKYLIENGANTEWRLSYDQDKINEIKNQIRAEKGIVEEPTKSDDDILITPIRLWRNSLDLDPFDEEIPEFKNKSDSLDEPVEAEKMIAEEPKQAGNENRLFSTSQRLRRNSLVLDPFDEEIPEFKNKQDALDAPDDTPKPPKR